MLLVSGGIKKIVRLTGVAELHLQHPPLVEWTLVNL